MCELPSQASGGVARGLSNAVLRNIVGFASTDGIQLVLAIKLSMSTALLIKGLWSQLLTLILRFISGL